MTEIESKLMNDWNEQADKYNDWSALGLDEMLEFAQEQAKKGQWNEIDYSKPETWPDLRTPVIRAWANGCFGNSEPFIDHEIAFLDEDDGNVFWNIQISSEQSRRTQAVSVGGQAYPPGILDHYTHWCYAPQLGG